MRTKVFSMLIFCSLAIANSFAANRYWVGGAAANWADATSWSESSGGTSGATAPTTGDDVIFDNGAPTVTIGANVSVNSITFSSSNVIMVGGNTITTSSMTVDNSQVSIRNNVDIVSALTFTGAAPSIKHSGLSSAAIYRFQLGKGGAFSLTGNSTSNYFDTSGNSSFRYNTTTDLTVFFKPTLTSSIAGMNVDKGLITIGNSIAVVRLTLSALNNQELILAPNVTLTVNSGGNSTLTATAGGGVVNASATGCKFVLKAQSTSILDGTKRIFKTGTVINHLEFSSATYTFVLFEPITVRKLTLTNGTINNSTNSITIAEGGSVVTGSGTTSAAVIAGLPGIPADVVATAGNGQASVAFTVPTGDGGAAIIDYTVTPYIGEIAGTPIVATSSPVEITDLTNGTEYTFKVKARNSVGSGATSVASNAVTPSIGTSLNPVNDKNSFVSVVNNSLTINHNSNVSANYSIHILQLNGQIAFAKSVPMAAGSNTIKIDINSLASGVYLVQLQDGANTLVTRKFIKK